MATKALTVHLEFAGGAELLLKDKLKSKTLDLPITSNDWTLETLSEWIRDNLLGERPELFYMDGNVRPGILVLVNDVDWELLGEKTYRIQNDDKITFISTLHGG